MFRFTLAAMLIVGISPIQAQLQKWEVRSRLAKTVTFMEMENGSPVTKTKVVTVAVSKPIEIDPTKCAVIICDMWDNHWCQSAATRCDALAKKANPVIVAARTMGMTIVHCPSDCMDFYKDSPARKRTLALQAHEPPKAKQVIDEPLPIDDSDGGCDDATPVKSFKAWKRQHEAIKIDEDKDFITDRGTDLWNVLKDRKLTTVLVLGVHTNMCVLNRTFAIKQLRKWDVECYLVRDLTDAMYNPKMRPFVTHDAGTNLVIEHIERFWCPSLESQQFLNARK